MPIVTDTLLHIVRRQIAEHGTLVWYDAEGAYADLVAGLTAGDVGAEHLVAYDPAGGFVRLRHDLEPLWAAARTPPRLLLYVPLARAAAYRALVEYEAAGAVMRPGQQPPERNTALASVAREALRSVVPPARREEIVADVAAGKLSLQELDALAEQGQAVTQGAINAVFGPHPPDEVALRFLASETHDEELERRDLIASLAALFSDLLGLALPGDAGLAALRAALARRVLLTDFVVALGDDRPPALATLPLAERRVAREAAVQLAESWRNRTDLAPAYTIWAGRVQDEVGVRGFDLTLEALARTVTFSAAEALLQEAVEQALAEDPEARLLALAEARREDFWARRDPAIKARWSVIYAAGRLLAKAREVARGLQGARWDAGALLARYAYGDEPWCTLDAAHRHLERDLANFELDPQRHDALLRLFSLARQRHAHAAEALAAAFTRAYAEAGFNLNAVLHQTDVFHEVVAPLRGQRVAYVLVDGLRFEMGRELTEVFATEMAAWTWQIEAALAVPPTVTIVGMAALLPGAEGGIRLVEERGALVPVLANEPDRPLHTRQDRVDYFTARVAGPVVVARLDQLAPLVDKHLIDELDEAQTVLVTATEEIDGLWENNPRQARRILDDVFSQLRRGLKALFDRGIEQAVITADHGYFFHEGLTPGQSIPAPQGRTALLKRRAWVGKGGAQSESYLYRPLSAFGVGGQLELATPWNLAAFMVPGGGTEYFHGGLSLPEAVIPVIKVRSPSALPAPGADLAWQLEPGSKTISARFFSVTIKGSSTQLLPLQPPLVRVEVRAGAQVISTPIAATYGFHESTKDVQLRADPEVAGAIEANTVTLQITEVPAEAARVTVHLLDATTGRSAARLEEVPIDILF